MPSKPAKPDRYVVDRVGTADPASSEYFVLDVVNDWRAREALAYLGNQYRQSGQNVKAQECWDQLSATLPAHRAVMEARNPKQSRAKKGNVHA